MVIHENDEDTPNKVETTSCSNTNDDRSFSTAVSTRHIENADRANNTSTEDIHPTTVSNIDSSYDGHGVDDVILYPAGGAFNKLRKKQQYLESLLKSHWYGYSQASTNLKKDYVVTNILAPMYNSGRQFKIYNPYHQCQEGEAEYTIPNVDIAYERMAQKLRDMKKSQTAELYHKRSANSGANTTAAGTAPSSGGSTEPPKKKRKKHLEAPAETTCRNNSRSAKGKKKVTPRPNKKTVVSKCIKKVAVMPKSRKRSNISTLRTPARQQRSVVAEKNEMVVWRDDPVKETLASVATSPKMKPSRFIPATSSLISNGSHEERYHSKHSAFTKRRSSSVVVDSTNTKNHNLYNERLLYSNGKNMMGGGTAPMEVTGDMEQCIIRVPAIYRRGSKITNQNHSGTTDTNDTNTDDDDDDDEEYVDFSDDDDDEDDNDNYGNNTAGFCTNDPTISWSSTIDDRNKPNSSNCRRNNRDDDVSATTASGTSRRCKDDLSLTELKEIIWSQWEQIDCWRRLCRQYRETYQIQREVILQQDQLISSSKNSNIGGIKKNYLLSIPRLSYNKSNISKSCYSVSTVNDQGMGKQSHNNNHCYDDFIATTTTINTGQKEGMEHDRSNNTVATHSMENNDHEGETAGTNKLICEV